MILNRQKELTQLEKSYFLPHASIEFVFGRKSIGKTALSVEFIKNKKALFLSSIPMASTLFFTSLAKKIIDYFSLFHLASNFSNFEQILELLYKQEIKEKLIIIFDDFHQIEKIDKNALNTLLKFWKKKLSKKNIQLIINTSLLYNEKIMLEINKNANNTIYLQSLSFNTIKTLIPNLPKLDQLSVYGLLGTSCKYLKYYNKNASLAENIYNLFLSSNSYLNDIGIVILKDEIQDINTYCSILYSISIGKKKIGEIAEYLDLKSTYLTRYIQKLIDMMIIKKELPLNENLKNSKYGRYEICDNLLKFWFCYIYGKKAEIATHKIETITKNIEKNFLEKTIQDSYKNYIKAYIYNNQKETFGYIPRNIGSWWDNNKNIIDIIAYDNKTITFVLILWQDEEMAKISYGKLKVMSEKFKTSLQKKYIIVTKNTYINAN